MSEPNEVPSYERARDELVAIVSRLESGAVPLDEALALWERGEELAAICQRWLDGAKAKIDAARPAAVAPPDQEVPHARPGGTPTG